MEEVLIKMAKDGDKEAFVELIEIYKRKLYMIAKTKLSSEEDVKDAIQETLLVAYKNIKKVKQIDKFNGWITKIVINKCNDFLRGRENIINYSYEELDCEKYMSFYSNDYIEIDDNINLFQMINFLTDEEKTIVILYFSKGYTTNEISEILNLNESTVRTKIRRVRIKIKEKYGKEGLYDRKDRRYN